MPPGTFCPEPGCCGSSVSVGTTGKDGRSLGSVLVKVSPVPGRGFVGTCGIGGTITGATGIGGSITGASGISFLVSVAPVSVLLPPSSSPSLSLSNSSR